MQFLDNHVEFISKFLDFHERDPDKNSEFFIESFQFSKKLWQLKYVMPNFQNQNLAKSHTVFKD